jgi:hypothetical protein
MLCGRRRTALRLRRSPAARVQNSPERLVPDRPSQHADDVAAALGDLFRQTASCLNVEQRITVADLPTPLRAAAHRFAAELRASNAAPEVMLRRIKQLLDSSPTSPHRENERRLARVVVSFAINSYFKMDDSGAVSAQ